MNRIILTLALVAMPLGLSAQGTSFWVESQNKMDRDNEVTPQLNISASKKYTPTFGLFLWAIAGQKFSEGIVGGLWAPKPGIEFNLGIGLEGNVNPGRTLGSVFLANRFGTLFGAAEYGGSGAWYLLVGNTPTRIVPNLGIGFRAQRFVGAGPKLEYKFSPNFAVWTVPYTWSIEGEKPGNTTLSVKFVP